MRAQLNLRPGTCFLCHQSVAKPHAARHVAACLKARPLGSGERRPALRLAVEGRYLAEYWMLIEISSAATLEDLDDFLRQTWIECCQHLSCFYIGSRRYLSRAFGEELDHETGLRLRLDRVIPPGTAFAHEYDFGSTTYLKLRTLGLHPAVLANNRVNILARNTPPVVACAKCRRPATIVEGGRNGLSVDRCSCETCAEAEIEDEVLRLPIVNSPRVGVCGYGD